MNIFRNIIFCLALVPSMAFSQNCEIHLMVAPVEQPEDLPMEINDMLMQRLTNVISSKSVTADPNVDQFFITAKINHIYKDVVPGPPTKYVIHSLLTLYIGDAINQKVYASTSTEIRGVGTTEQRAYINALSTISNSNSKIASLVEQGTRKIIDYYDKNYQTILAQAKQAMALKDFQKALYLSTSVPQCCAGYGTAFALTMNIYNKYINYDCKKLMMAAKAEWSAHPDVKGAENAQLFLMQIDSDSNCNGDAIALQNEIKKVVKYNWDFENHKKYNDTVDVEKLKIAAAKAIGVAYGNGQKSTTTNIMWLK